MLKNVSNGASIGLDTSMSRHSIARNLKPEFDKVAGPDKKISRQDLQNTYDTVPPFSAARSAAVSLLGNPDAFRAFDKADGKHDGYFTAESIDAVLNTVYNDLPDKELAHCLGVNFSALKVDGEITFAGLETVLASSVSNEAKSVAATLRANPKLFERVAGADGKIDWDDFRTFAKATRE